jgi:hypothetical protein
MPRAVIVLLTLFIGISQCVPLSGAPLSIRDDEKDPDDLSFIQSIAAIGDSYSAGIGAGKRLGSLTDISKWGDWGCESLLYFD